MKKWILIILVILVSSCGTRKRTAQLKKLQLEIEQIKMIQIQNKIVSNANITKQNSIITIEPINHNEETVFNGSKFKNAKVIIDSSTSKIESTIKDNSIKSVKDKNAINLDFKEKDTDVLTEKPNPYIWAGLTLVFLFVVYLAYRYITRSLIQ